MSVKQPTKGIKQLEMTMRDVMDCLEDAASFMNYHSCPDTIEILSIEAPGRPTVEKTNIIQLNQFVEEDYVCSIVEYLTQRELKKSA